MKIRLIKWESGLFSLQTKDSFYSPWRSEAALFEDMREGIAQYHLELKYPRELADIIARRLILEHQRKKQKEDAIAEVIWKQEC